MSNDHHEPTEREKRMAARAARVAAAMPKRETVRVEPRDDILREVLKHPRTGNFRSSGSMEWPLDRFTRRRIADGSVKVVSGEQGATAHEQGATPAHRRSTHRAEPT